MAKFFNSSQFISFIHKFILFGFPLIFFVGCTPKNTWDSQFGKVLRVGNGGEPRDLDPHTVTGVPEAKIIFALMEGLMAYHPTDDNIPYPGVAETWKLSKDQRVWTFKLRKNARWSNGDPVTANDFVYAWRRAITPELGCEYADWFYIIEGAEEWHSGKLDDFSKVGLKAIDSHTFQVTLRKPIADFLKIILNHSFLPVHPSTIEANGGIGSRTSSWTRPETYVGNGPFQLADWQPESQIRVERNPYYWDAETVRLDGIIFYPISDENTELRAFESGQLHLTNSLPSNRRKWYRENRPTEIRIDPYAGVYFFRINTTIPVLNDVRIREALSLSIDREAIVSKILQGGERPAFAYVPSGIGGYQPPKLIEYDPAKARQLLEEAGYPNGKGMPQIDFLFNTSDNHRRIAEAVQNMWRQELGIDIRLANKEWKTYLDTTQKMNYQIARAGWIASLYPHSFLRIYTADSSNNETGFKDPEFDRLIDEIFSTMDESRRNQLVETAERRLLEQFPVIPLYWYTNVYLIKESVKGWNPKLVDQRPYKLIDLVE